MNAPLRGEISEGAAAQAFVVGVTGHRDIRPQDAGHLAEGVRSALADVRHALGAGPVVVVSGLAAGADMLAAEAALAEGLPVIAVLPMPRANYEADFAPADLARFRALLDDPRVSLREIPFPAGATPADLADPAQRDGQYARLADYLRRRANLLVALWDGRPNGLPGGTGDVAHSYLAGQPGVVIDEVPASVIDGEDCGNAVYWIPTRRLGGGDGDGADPGPPRYLVSNGANDCYAAHAALPPALVERWRGYADFQRDYHGPMGRGLPAYPLDTGPDAAGIDRAFQRVDQLASLVQSGSNRLFQLFALLAAGMGLAFLLYAKLWASPVLLVLYIALFAVGYALFRYSARAHLHGRHLSCRVLAETLRVQYFLALSGAGAGYDLGRILDLTSIARFERFGWLPEALRSAEPLTYPDDVPDAAIETTRRAWIAGQATYFGRKLHRLHHDHRRLTGFKTALLIGSVLGAAVLILFKKELLGLSLAGQDGKAWLVFLMGLLPLWAAIWELYHGKMATHELLWQYANQERYFSAAMAEIALAQDRPAQQRILRDLADKALIEIYLWSVHRYHREHEPPTAG